MRLCVDCRALERSEARTQDDPTTRAFESQIVDASRATVPIAFSDGLRGHVSATNRNRHAAISSADHQPAIAAASHSAARTCPVH